MTEISYEFNRDKNGIVWVTLEPLIKQVKEVVNNSNNIDTTDMTENEKKAVMSTKVCTQAVYQFLNALQTEFVIKELMEKNNADKE